MELELVPARRSHHRHGSLCDKIRDQDADREEKSVIADTSKKRSKMLRSLIAVFFLTIFPAAFALTQPNLQFGLSAYPNFSGARLAASTTANQMIIDSIEAREVSRPAFSLGLAVQWRGAKAGFRTGMQINDTGYRSVREPVPAGVPAPPDAITRTVVYRNLNLEVPAEVLFIHEAGPKDRLNFMMGFSAAYNLNNFEDNIFYSGERIGRESEKLSNAGFRRLQMAFQTGVGWQRDFGRSVVLFLQPTFQFWYTALLEEPEDNVNRNLYNIGLKTGILFRTGRSLD